MAMTQLIIENVVETNPNAVVLKFRFPENGVETPSFVVNARKAKSYTKWNISMLEKFETKTLSRTEELFEEVIKSSEFEVILGECKNSEIDGELLVKLIQLTMWLESITCDNPEFVINYEQVFSYAPGARKVTVKMA